MIRRHVVVIDRTLYAITRKESFFRVTTSLKILSLIYDDIHKIKAVKKFFRKKDDIDTVLVVLFYLLPGPLMKRRLAFTTLDNNAVLDYLYDWINEKNPHRSMRDFKEITEDDFLARIQYAWELADGTLKELRD